MRKFNGGRALAAGIAAVGLAACGSSGVASSTSLTDSQAFKDFAAGVTKGAASRGVHLTSAQSDSFTNCIFAKAQALGYTTAGAFKSHESQILPEAATCIRQALGISTSTGTTSTPTSTSSSTPTSTSSTGTSTGSSSSTSSTSTSSTGTGTGTGG